MRRCFVFSAAEFDGLRESPRSGDFLIAADAGYLLCQKIGLRPDLLIGDFDSMPAPPDAPSIPHVERVPVMKDDTDTMLALKAGLSRNCDEFHIYGGTGGRRMDHTFANLQGLLYLRRHKARGFLYGRDFVWTAIENETFEVAQTVPDGLLSVFALSGRVRGVTIAGVRYPLGGAELAPDFPLGVSNHITDARASVSVENGALLLGWELPPLS
ncbi:MAG: thiamine diphosphokinase [Oscillibacter sp.]|nr:thiamine diphosphokinase [Oscillibacter sp.]